MKIAKLALITAILGLIILSILALYLEPKPTQISDIDESKIGNFVKITGQVVNVKQSKITSFDLSDNTGGIKVVSFNKADISKGDQLEIIGKVDKYYGLLEVKADEIRKVG